MARGFEPKIILVESPARSLHSAMTEPQFLEYLQTLCEYNILQFVGKLYKLSGPVEIMNQYIIEMRERERALIGPIMHEGVNLLYAMKIFTITISLTCNFHHSVTSPMQKNKTIYFDKDELSFDCQNGHDFLTLYYEQRMLHAMRISVENDACL